MRSVLLTVLLTAACGSDDPSGMLSLKPDTPDIVVSGTTFLTAYLNDGTGTINPVSVSYAMDPTGIISLTPHNGIQMVTGLAAGQVVVTATGFDQTAKVGFTVTTN
jgi:hypothetical protein